MNELALQFGRLSIVSLHLSLVHLYLQPEITFQNSYTIQYSRFDVLYSFIDRNVAVYDTPLVRMVRFSVVVSLEHLLSLTIN